MIIPFTSPEPSRTPNCGACHCPMHLAKIEWETERIDLQTFDCPTCTAVETRSVTRQ